MVWSPPALSLEVLESIGELETAEPAWRAVWQRDPAATPFQSPDWLLPWTRHLWGGGKLRVFAVRHGREPVAFAPLFLWGFGPRTEAVRLSFLGAGISDHLDLIAAPEFALPAARCVLRHLAATRSEWHICDLQELPPGSPLLAVEIPPELAWRNARCGVCPVLRLPATFDELLSSVNGAFRHNLRTAQHRLHQAGAVGFLSESTDTGPPEPLLLDLFRLHSARWRHRGEAGVLSARRLRRFHLEAASRLAAAGGLRLHGLRLNGQTIAVQYDLRRGPRHYFYLSGFDPAFARLSPGIVLMAETIRRAIEENASEIDFLRRREAFKYQWGAEDTFNRRLCLKMRSRERRLPAPEKLVA